MSTAQRLDLSEMRPQIDVDPAACVYHQLAPASEFAAGEGRPFTIDGIHLAVFLYEGSFHAVDNRCPHMGYPMSKGSIRDGVLICHWHHWEFDLKTGGCLLTSGDDLKAFPVEVRDDGYAWVGIPPGEKEEARLRLVARGKRALEQGLKDRSSFLIAKAVAALRQTGATPARNHSAGPLLRRTQNERRLVVGRRHPNPRSQLMGRHRRGRPKPLSRPRFDPNFAAHLRLVAAASASPFPAAMTTKTWPPSSVGSAPLSISGTTARPSASCSPCTTATAARKPSRISSSPRPRTSTSPATGTPSILPTKCSRPSTTWNGSAHTRFFAQSPSI